MPKRQKFNEGQDIISNLHDYIIGHILSFLSTKDAVRTSVLSKRWIYMWKLVTKLDFNDEEKSYHSFSSDRSERFSNFVCRVLFHINSPNIEKFNLFIRGKYDAYYLNQWLSALLNKGVRYIHVYSWQNYFNICSYPLFQSPSLETLVLQMRLCCYIKVPTFAFLPSLTILNLTKITFTHYSSSKPIDLTLKFPLLRKYRTSDCTWLGVKSITLEAPLLEEVIIDYWTTRRKLHTKIKFCASHLAKFVYPDFMSSLSETSLVDDEYFASADIFLPNLKHTCVEETWVSLRKLLSLFTNTECLSLYCLQGLAQVKHYLADNPAFGMLRHLRLGIVTGEVLLSFILKSPCLQTLVLQMEDSSAEMQNFTMVSVPDCFLSTLKVVQFERFCGYECELSFAKFVMENARVLERINISFHWELPNSEKEKAKETLFLLNTLR